MPPSPRNHRLLQLLARKTRRYRTCSVKQYLSKNEFGPGMLVKFISLVTEQNTYFSNFEVLSNKANVDFFKQQLNDRSVAEVEKLRDLAESKMSGLMLTLFTGSHQSTAQIVQLKKTENQLADS
ncbi:nitrate- and nitrite sensing domain-containing protein [Vibrio lentus]|nr:nitrate- and nitrite sensing domain-containing protein [Vibrio lentus]